MDRCDEFGDKFVGYAGNDDPGTSPFGGLLVVSTCWVGVSFGSEFVVGIGAEPICGLGFGFGTLPF